MNIDELIENRTNQLKQEVGLALSRVECEQFVGSCIYSVPGVKNLNLHDVSGCCTDGKHHRQITEKELKLAAKEIKLKYGLIEYIINKVRHMQANSGNNR